MTIKDIAENIGVNINKPFTFSYENKTCTGIISHSGFHMKKHNTWVKNHKVLSNLINGKITVMKA